jgi:hypothetical protein
LTEPTVKLSFYGKLMEYFTKYPDSNPTPAAKAVLNQLDGKGLEARVWKNLVHEADTVKGRARAKLAREGKLNSLQLDRPVVIRGVKGVGALDPHWFKFGPELLPGWLSAAVGRAAIAGFGGWRVARPNMFQWYAMRDGERYSAQCYGRKRSYKVFPGRRRYDLERLRHAVFLNLMCVLDRFGPDDREDPVRLQGYAAEIDRFMGRLLAGPDGFHLGAKVDGLKQVGVCQFEFPPGVGLRRVRINDGSHPGGWIEFEFEGLRRSEREVRGLRANLDSVSAAMVQQSAIVAEYARQMALHLSVMQQISEATRKFTEAVEKFLEGRI